MPLAAVAAERIAPESKAESRVVGRAEGRAEGSGGLKRDTDALRADLEVEAGLAIPAVVRTACEALCVPHEGPLLALVLRLR